MATCACSMSSLHVRIVRPCCPSFQARIGRGVHLPERRGATSDPTVAALRTASQIINVDSKAQLRQSPSLNNSEASSRLRNNPSKQSGIGAGLQDHSKTVPRRKGAEVQYRVHDAVDNSSVTPIVTNDIDRTVEEKNVIDIEVEGQVSRVSFGFDSDGQNEWGESAAQGPRSLAVLPGGKRVVELVAAWDGLAGRLPPEFSRSSGSDLLLRTLKFTVTALQHTSPDDNGRTALCRALAVAHTLADLGMDAEVISTALLREVVDAGLVSYGIIEQNLGGNIAHLLHDCSRVRHIPSRVETLDDDTATALRQFCLAFHDIRAVVVELASQLDTMKHIYSFPRYRQQVLALETMQIYAPLAHAIGTGSMALELEDLAFRVLFPDSYSYIENWLSSHWVDGSAAVDELKAKLLAALEADKELQTLVRGVLVLGRYKSRFSTMRKLLKDGRKPEEVYDVLGLRVILEPKVDDGAAEERECGVRACYRAMEVATTIWQEVPGRLKDYIANHKQNGYESLHFAVHVSDGNSKCPPMEIQIRTTAMDAAAVSGEASHSLYKGGMTDPEQIRNLKLMVAAANAAASRFGEIAGTAVDFESGDRANDGEDQIFKMFDKNQDGVISVEEFREVITELGADEGDALELMQIVDLNTDGCVSAEEFSKFRHQIQIYQNLAGVDREFSSQLGSKLQGSNEFGTRKPRLSFGNLSTNKAEVMNRNSQDESVCSAGQLGNFLPLDWLSGEVYNQVTAGTLRANEMEKPKEFESTSALEQVEKRTVSNVVSTFQKDNRSNSRSPFPAGKPKPNLVKPLQDSGNQYNPDSEILTVLPKLEDEISKWPDSVKTAAFRDGKLDGKGKETSTESVIDEQLSKVRQLIARGDLLSARDLIAKLSAPCPTSTKVLLHHASLDRKCGYLESASALYSQAISMFESKEDLGVEYVRALQAWASLEAQTGNHTKARYLFTASVEASDKADLERSLRGAGVYGLHGWARLEEKCGNWSKARELLVRAAELQPGNAVIHQSRATLEARVHNYAAARIHFKHAVDAAPKDVKCWHAWAMFEASQGNLQKMRKLFRCALTVDPKNMHSLQAWAHHEGLTGTEESQVQARKLYQDCVDINPDCVYCWQSWGILERDGENFEGARVLFERGLEANPKSVPCLQAYAHMERKLGNLDVAKKLLRRALAVDPDNAAALMELAVAEDMSANGELALELYKRAARVDRRKSFIKRRLFESRKEWKSDGVLPKPKSRLWRRKPQTKYAKEESSLIPGFDIGEFGTQFERIYSGVSTGGSDE